MGEAHRVCRLPQVLEVVSRAGKGLGVLWGVAGNDETRATVVWAEVRLNASPDPILRYSLTLRPTPSGIVVSKSLSSEHGIQHGTYRPSLQGASVLDTSADDVAADLSADIGEM